MGTERLRERLLSPGPKRLLALDGGGLRGLVTLGFLARIERVLRERAGRPDAVLADYFDLVGGTSTGALIATALALGWPVSRVRDVYLELGRTAFRRRRSWLGPIAWLLRGRYDDRALEGILRNHLAERALDTPDLETGLVVVTKRADTGSVWALTNVPTHRYFDANRHILLTDLLRASTAAPTYFTQHVVPDVGGGEEAVFVDGGMSMHNNPALKVLMVATLDGFGLRWPWGSEKLLLCSVGTGRHACAEGCRSVSRWTTPRLLPFLIVQLLADASELNETLLQWMSESPTARSIDSQIQSLEPDHMAREPLLSYLRYNVELHTPSLAGVGVHLEEEEVEELRRMCSVDSIPHLDRIGAAAADAQVRAEHFPAAFDPLPVPERAQARGGS